MINEEYNPSSGLFLYSVICDGSDCDESLPVRGSELIAIVDAISARWLMRIPKQKFSGHVYRDYCPKCRKNESHVQPDLVSGICIQFGSTESTLTKKG